MIRCTKFDGGQRNIYANSQAGAERSARRWLAREPDASLAQVFDASGEETASFANPDRERDA